ncbi:MAG: hypothetical protein ACI8VT_002542 [Saprospiraceae bacterium]
MFSFAGDASSSPQEVMNVRANKAKIKESAFCLNMINKFYLLIILKIE